MQIGIAFPFFCVTMKPKWKLSGSEMDVKWCSVEVVPTQGKNIACNTKGEAICQWV